MCAGEYELIIAADPDLFKSVNKIKWNPRPTQKREERGNKTKKKTHPMQNVTQRGRDNSNQK